MVADELRRFPLAFLKQEIDHALERVDQQLIAVDGLLLHHGFADVEDMAGIHTVNAVQLDIFRRNFKDVLHRLFGVDHSRHQLLESGVLADLSHGKGSRWTVLLSSLMSLKMRPMELSVLPTVR